MTKRLACSILFALLMACGKPAASPQDAASSEPPMPTGKGAKRALVLVPGDEKKPDPASQPVDDQYSTRRIVEKVTSP